MKGENMDWRKEKQLKQKAQEYYEKGLSYNQVYIHGYADGYAKAVDEVRYALDETTYNINDADALFDDIVEILENLKGGAE